MLPGSVTDLAIHLFFDQFVVVFVIKLVFVDARSTARATLQFCHCVSQCLKLGFGLGGAFTRMFKLTAKIVLITLKIVYLSVFRAG